MTARTANPTAVRTAPRTARPGTRTEAALTTGDLAAATRSVAAAIASVPPHDRRWDLLGPLVSALADELRRALGETVSHTATAVPSVVRQRDLAVAARALLGPATVRDLGAARTVRGLAAAIADTV